MEELSIAISFLAIIISIAASCISSSPVVEQKPKPYNRKSASPELRRLSENIDELERIASSPLII